MPGQPRAAVPYDEPPMQTSASTPTDRAVPGDGIRLPARDWGGRGPAVLLCVAGADEHAGAGRGAVGRALDLLRCGQATWFEDAGHDLPLERRAGVAAALGRFAREAAGRG